MLRRDEAGLAMNPVPHDGSNVGRLDAVDSGVRQYVANISPGLLPGLLAATLSAVTPAEIQRAMRLLSDEQAKTVAQAVRRADIRRHL